MDLSRFSPSRVPWCFSKLVINAYARNACTRVQRWWCANHRTNHLFLIRVYHTSNILIIAITLYYMVRNIIMTHGEYLNASARFTRRHLVEYKHSIKWILKLNRAKGASPKTIFPCVRTINFFSESAAQNIISLVDLMLSRLHPKARSRLAKRRRERRREGKGMLYIGICFLIVPRRIRN